MSRTRTLLARMLVVVMAWAPFSAEATLVGTGEIVAGARGQANRDTVVGFLNRADVARQLEAHGLSAAAATDRVNALTEDELSRLAGRIDTLPAGAADSWVWAIVIIGLVLYFVYYKR
ncbi:MAG: PA2779 family protein [Burkholderiales bacterium]|nr:PA2779 family protein [Burkholderiales bacterium]